MTSVLVLGAGVAGMTAAHELALRGFAVTVVEADAHLVGGLARTQYCDATAMTTAPWQRLTGASVSVAEALATDGSGRRKCLPGEHGYRFFPAFYRHLDDTLGRTPACDPLSGERDGERTLLDALTSTRVVGYATAGDVTVREFLRVTPDLSALASYVKTLAQSANVPFTASDMLKVQSAMLKYATACDARRGDLEALSWWTFMAADDLTGPMRAWVDRAPEALVAMSARRSDARTYGTVSLQMMLDQLGRGDSVDRTLEGPTSEAWLEPWRAFLERHLGVSFRMGTRVDAVTVAGADLMVTLRAGTAPPFTVKIGAGNPYDFVLCALPLEAALPLFRPLASADASTEFQSLLAFGVAATAPSSTGLGAHYGRQSGVQFYLREQLNLLPGHLYAIDSAWGLTAIEQGQFWPRFQARAYPDAVRSILSVDVGLFNAADDAGRTAASCAVDELAARVWTQLRECFGSPGVALRDAYGRKVTPRFALPAAPLAWHVDDGLYTSGVLTGGALLGNLPGWYRQRSGASHATKYRYDLTLGGRVVFAGPHMQTTTRLTTMEAANESARYAVNAILDATNYAGEAAPLFPVEAYEPDAVQALQALDAQLRQRGLPHVIDTLRLRESIDLLLP